MSFEVEQQETAQKSYLEKATTTSTLNKGKGLKKDFHDNKA